MSIFYFVSILMILLVSYIFGRISKYITKTDFGRFNNLMVGFIGIMLGQIIGFNFFGTWLIGVIIGLFFTVILFYTIGKLVKVLEK